MQALIATSKMEQPPPASRLWEVATLLLTLAGFIALLGLLCRG